MEALVAGVALVGLVSLVAAGVGLEVGLGARVGLEVGQLGEGLGAVWMATLVGLVPGVSPDVLLQVGQLGELPLTDLAAVWLDAEVNPHVLRQVGAVREGFAALAALVGLVSLVAAGVGLEVGLGARVGLELVVVLLGVRQVGEVHGGAMKAWWTGGG